MCFLVNWWKKSFSGLLLAVATLQDFVFLIDLEENHNYIFSVTSCGAAFSVSSC